MWRGLESMLLLQQADVEHAEMSHEEVNRTPYLIIRAKRGRKGESGTIREERPETEALECNFHFVTT
jgi:hypothetical protein